MTFYGIQEGYNNREGWIWKGSPEKRNGFPWI